MLALLAAIIAVAAPALADGAATLSHRTISSVATISWDDGGKRSSASSNRVDILVDAPDSRHFTIRAYRFATNSASERLTIAQPLCLGASGSAPVVLARGWQAQPLTPALVIAAPAVRAGEPLLFILDYPNGNADPDRAETVTGVVLARSGDRETLTITETGSNTGSFSGYIQTARTPSPFQAGDCLLTVGPGDKILVESLRTGSQTPLVSAEVDVLVDPFGIVFDSFNGAPVSGARITLVDDATGRPAEVFGDDGSSSYPATVISGETVRDSGGTVYTFLAGDYRFPLVRQGRYRLVVQPPANFTSPSTRTPAELSALRRPDGEAFTIAAGSYGGIIVLDSPAPVRIDIPLDKSGAPIELSKDASQSDAGVGESVRYKVTLRNNDAARRTGAIRLTDRFPAGTRLRSETLHLDGRQATAEIAEDGRSFELAVPALAAGASSAVSYALEVGADVRPGDALNRAQARDDLGNVSNVADAIVRIRRDGIVGRMTIIGRVIAGECGTDAAAKGIAGVRIMLEDGSYAVTDADGRYHFEGLKSGLHVVQLDDQTLPADRAVVACKPDTRSAGRSLSRFVEGRGGSLMRADFRARQVTPRSEAAATAPARPAAASDADAAGAEIDWLAGQEPGIAWLFPTTDHNPRAPIVRVAIKHLPGQSVKLSVDGRPVDPIAFDGTTTNGARTMAVSVWRGVPLETRSTNLVADVRTADGTVAETLRHVVHHSASPMRAQLLRDRSVLIADGVTRPVIALRLTDRDGRPVRHGLVGEYTVPAPYYPAVEADAQQARQLAGLERARPFWRVVGDDGIAYVELEPTTASGTVSLRFDFRDGEATSEQRVELWLDPGQRPWTIVGLAEGTIGFNRLASGVEALGQDDGKVLTEGRLALYAKGRVRGRWLMTMAYDSARKEDETRFGGVIDPDAYYTVYADRSERRYDAASVRKLYLKLERPQFYALFGDYETGIDEPQLARYVRAFNGVKAEYRSGRVAAIAFAADTPNRHRRDDIQGNGLTGPYALGARDILANSERVSIEVRDRLRSDRIVETRLLTRHIDYDIDYPTGTLRFREPILSRSSALDPQFIVAEYEVDGVASRRINAGGRASWKSRDEKLQIAATAIRDADDRGSAMLGGGDLRYRPSAGTEIRAEIAVSDAEPKADGAGGGTATAWLVEAEHHGPRYDLLGYARQQESGFGIGQLSGAENGTRKLGFDARARLSETLSLSGSAWHEDYLASDARRVAGRGLIEYRNRDLSARAGITLADDRLADGRSARSTILQLGAAKRFFDNRLELDAQTELPLGGSDESIDFPARHKLGARYAITDDVQLVGAYEIADGEHIDARTARIGFDLKPWAGARIAMTGNVQDIAEYGPRSFAAYGLSQSLVLDDHWSVDLSLDGNRTLSGIDPARVLNPFQPVASGGYIGAGGTVTEDFTAITAGATYRARRWSATARAEYRAGALDDRYGFTAAALRQIGEGSAVGGAVNWFAADGEAGTATRTANAQLSWAHRPAGGRWSWLEKLELREDRVEGAAAGVAGPLGTPLTIDGDARSRRMVNALSVNYASNGEEAAAGRSEISLFWGSRYVAEKFGEEDISGWSNLFGVDLRFDFSDSIDFGLAATIRHGAGLRTIGYAAGPSIGITPFKNAWLSVGWNILGFDDRDFEEARYTRSGPYVTMRAKFDQLSLHGLGLGRK